MGYQISPGVNVSEVDITTVVPSVLTTAGAFAGYFDWGPVDKITLIDNEITLRNTFGTPSDDSCVEFFTCANFLSYGNNLNVVRSANSTMYNATSNTTVIQIKNSDVFQATLLNQNNNNMYGPFVARYPGSYGNSLSVSVCANTALFSTWSYSSYFTSAPTTSSSVNRAGGANDEMHIVVVDAGGLFSGTIGTVLETFPFVSKASDGTNSDGTTNYYKQVIFNQSQYIYATDPADYVNTVNTWNTPSSNTNFAQLSSNMTYNLNSGYTDDPDLSDAQLSQSWALFRDKETIDISLVLTGAASVTVQQYVIDNIVNAPYPTNPVQTGRGDCVAFMSPPQSAVVNQAGSETTNIISWATSLGRTSSRVVVDSGWKYQFDIYNNVYRWIPLNADIAGLCVYTDAVKDPWWSPAGFNRGQIKNAIKLAWNPQRTQRDTLYNAGINPVVSFAGQGIVLFGDKTFVNKPFAFDRINVRRLFLTLEKSISKAAQFSLFEFNDDFTRAQFVALVTPYLRDVQGRRGISDFRVVCDTTNNTPQVIDSNQFVGDIYIKPNRSINYIQLNFVAVGTGVDFNTIVGQSTVE